MTAMAATIQAWAIDAGFVLLMAALVLAFLRLARGPALDGDRTRRLR